MKTEVFWPLDDIYYRPLHDRYYPGTIVGSNSDGHFVVNFNDGDVEKLDPSTETGRPCNGNSSNLARSHHFR